MVRFALVHIPVWDEEKQDTVKKDVLHIFEKSHDGSETVRQAINEDKEKYGSEYADHLAKQKAA